jgi:hypothetical protein
MSYHAVAALTVAFSLALGVIQEPVPAALPVGADCARHVATHTLIRNDVLARLDAADQNLPKAEAALAQAQADLRALKAAADQLQAQKALLEQHVGLLEQALKLQGDVCAPSPARVVTDAAGAAWEAIDAPLGFAAGAGMCVGIAWGLNQVAR